MTDIRQAAVSADEDSFMNVFFDSALRLRELEDARADTQLSHDSAADPRRAELPPQDADKAS